MSTEILLSSEAFKRATRSAVASGFAALVGTGIIAPWQQRILGPKASAFIADVFQTKPREGRAFWQWKNGKLKELDRHDELPNRCFVAWDRGLAADVFYA